MSKKLFFDIDGTLVSFRTHLIPESTIDALTRAKAAGAEIYIATGRPVPIITNLGAISHLIDGYLTTNGAYCFVGNDVILCQEIAASDVEIMLADAREKDYSILFSCEKDVCVYNEKACVQRIFSGELAIAGMDSLPPYAGQRVLQATIFCPDDVEASLMKRLGGCISGRWHPEFTDITSALAGKGRGLEAMASYLGIDISDTVAFGDGGNDIPLLLAAGTGIAMGNAREDVKAIADYVTSSVDEDGIARALDHFGI